MRDEAKARWKEQIDRQIDSRNFAQATNLLRDAQAEFPGDSELEELAKQIRQGEERVTITQALVDQARAFCVHGRFDEAATLLRKACEMDDRDLRVRGQLVDTLVQHARTLLDKNARRAGELVQSALNLDPLNAQARGLSSQVADRKRDEAIEQAISRARQLQTGGDSDAARTVVDQAMALYPGVARLQQLKSELDVPGYSGSPVQKRRLDLEKLKQFEARAGVAFELSEQREILAGVRELAAKHLDDPEFQAALIAIEMRYVALSRAPQPPTPAGRAQQPTFPAVIPPSIPELTPSSKTPAGKPPDMPPVAVTSPDIQPTIVRPLQVNDEGEPPVSKALTSAPRVAPVPVVPPAKQRAPLNWKLWGAGAAGFAVVAAIATAIGLWYQHQQGGPQNPQGKAVAGLPVDVRTVPEGATILINDKASGTSNLQLKLAPGTYRVNAVKEGYRPSQTTLKVAAGESTASANIILQAIPTTLRLLTDFASASVNFDGHPQSSLQNGQLIVDNVATGPHTLTIGSGASGATIHFDAREGTSPVVTSLEAAKDTSAILITNLGGRARVHSSQKAGTITFDGKPVGPVDPAGVELTNVGSGDHEITVSEGEEHRKVVYETALVPALTVYLNNQQSVGTLLITTGEDNVNVSINGQTIRATTRRGQMRIPNLPVRQYVIGVAKEGFQPVAEQRVSVIKGEEAKLAFQLRPIPAIATLHVTGAMPGTQVSLDGKPVGTVGQDGAMPMVQVAPGGHAVQLHKDEYKPKNFQLNFVPGKDVTLSAADVALEGNFGTLVVAVNPAAAQLTVQRAGEAQGRPMNANSVHLPEGSYTVTASSPHFVSQSATVEIAVGGTKNVTLQLAPERVAPPPPVKTAVGIGMRGWQLPAAWQPEGDHYTRRGGNLCLFTPQGPGTYSFTASMKRGKQLRWVAHVVNDKNYAEFELDNEFFYRRQVTDGKGRELLRRKHGLPMDPVVGATVQVKVSPGGIVQSIQRPDGWAVLDTWMDPVLHEGRFGFLIPRRDEVNLSAFWFSGSE